MDVERAIPQMRSYFRPALFFLLCVIAAGGGVACTHSRQASGTTSKCPADLFVIRADPNAPVRLSVLGTECPTPYFAKIEFKVETGSTRPISRYEVHLFTSHDGQVENDSSTSVTGQPHDSIFSRDETRSDSFGVSLKRGWFSDPKTVLTLRVTSVTFTDGTVWKSAPD